MKKLILAIIFSPFLLPAQNIKQPRSQVSNVVCSNWLIGTWRSDDDKKWVLKFGPSNGEWYVENDSASTSHFIYKLSTTCNIKDTSSVFKLDVVNSVYLLLLFQDTGYTNQCNELENFDKKTLSWMNENGKVFLFTKVANPAKKKLKNIK